MKFTPEEIIPIIERNRGSILGIAKELDRCSKQTVRILKKHGLYKTYICTKEQLIVEERILYEEAQRKDVRDTVYYKFAEKHLRDRVNEVISILRREGKLQWHRL